MRVEARRGLLGVVLMLATGASACTDAPSAPEARLGPGGVGQLSVQPTLTATGSAATSHQQQDAVNQAFGLVDRFRLVVRRPETGEVVLDEVIEVEGDPPFELSARVPLQEPNELFEVELVAMQGATELFRAGPFETRAMPEGVETRATPVDADLEYVGPGATAASMEVSPGVVAVAPGGEATLRATVRDGSGKVLTGVPLAWSTSDAGVATMGRGTLTGVSDGAVTVDVVTPTGVSASARAYVVAGAVSFVWSGGIWQAPLGGEPSKLVESGTQPSWSGDGSVLFYSRSGTVYRQGGTEVTSGGFPSVSPDGTKLAVDRGGVVYFTNLDGTNETEGPAGSAPVWAPGGGALVVAGGSIERVHAGGEGRTRVVDDPEAGLPAVSDGGIAYRGADGGIYVGGRRISAEGQTSGSRPTFSANGRWVVFGAGGELHVAPADGSGPSVSWGVRGSSPAWPGHGFATEPTPVSVSGIAPEHPEVGDELTIEGDGFDWIIPENNRVVFPGEAPEEEGGSPAPARAVEAPILEVGPGALVVRVPEGVEPGAVTVATRAGETTFDFQPAPATLRAAAETESGGPVAGVAVEVTAPDGETTTATTGEDGTATFEGLDGGATYGLAWSAPEAFEISDAPESVELPWSETTEAKAVLKARVVDFKLVPDERTVAVGGTMELEVRALDALGNEVTEGVETSWRKLVSKIGLTVADDGLHATLTGQHPSSEPGDARFEVVVGGIERRFGATVRSQITGRVRDGSTGEPLEGIEVSLSGAAEAATTTDIQGRYAFTGLLAGGYAVRATPPPDRLSEPPQHDLNVWEANPTGTANFRMVRPEPEQPGGEGGGEIIVMADINVWGSGSAVFNADNEVFTENLVTNGDRNRVVWYRGHHSWLNDSSFYDVNSYFRSTVRLIEGLGRTLDIVPSGAPGTLSIPDDAASFWMWLPQDQLTQSDLDTIRRYVNRGGRFIMIGENDGGTFNQANARVQELMAAFGSPAQFRDDCLSGSVSDLEADPLTDGISSIALDCSSYFDSLGPNDDSLARHVGGTVVARIGVGVPSAPMVQPVLPAADLAIPDAAASGPVNPDAADPTVGPGGMR